MAGGPETGRRNFLNWLLGGSAVTFLSAIAYPLLKYLTPPPGQDSTVEAVDAGSVDSYAINSGKIVKFGNRPALVIRDQQNEFKAVIAVCTHLGCTVQYVPKDHDIWCACHNGKYDINGRNISGPPPRPLTQLKVNIKNNQVLISQEA